MRPLLLLATMLVLAFPLTAASDGDVHARNVSFIRDMIGADDLTQPATMSDGRVLTLAAAIDDAADRAGGRDLGALPIHPTTGALDWQTWGDIWVLSTGPGACQSTVYGPGSPTTMPLHASLWVYEGDTSESWQSADLTMAIGWTSKDSFLSTAPAHWWAFGNNDHYCFDTPSGHFAFPYLDGVVRVGAGYSGEVSS